MRRNGIKKLVAILLAAVFISLAVPVTVQLAEEVKVYVTPKGKKYHKQGCAFLKGKGTAITLEEAKKKGLTPCKVCKPPE